MAVIPYEFLMHVIVPTDPLVEAERILACGWDDRGYGAIHLEGSIPWLLRGEDERSWNYRIHCWHMVESLLKAHSLTGKGNYLLPAIRVASDWVAHHHEKTLDVVSPFAWFGMAVGMRSYRFAYILDAGLLSGLIGEEQHQVLWSSLLAHQDFLANDNNISFHSNHGFVQVAGQMAMGRRFAKVAPSMDACFRQGQQRLKTMIKQQFANDGAHLEHSPNYHRMVCESLKSLIDAGLIEDSELLDLAIKTEKTLSWFITPGGQIANFGDTDYESLACSSHAAEKRWVSPEMRYRVSGGAVGIRPPEAMAVFPQAGYCIIHAPDTADPGNARKASYLAQLAAFHSRTHKHADDLTFIWTDRGSDILVDSGRYGYIGRTEVDSDLWLDGHWYSDPYRVYCESTHAHNTLEFDGRNYKRKGVKPYGSALSRWIETPGGIYAVESVCKHFGRIRRNRVLVFNPGNWLVVFDWFRDNAKQSHTVRQWFHFAPALKLFPEGDGYVASIQDSSVPIRVKPLLVGVKTSPIFRGVNQEHTQGWFSPRERELVPNDAVYFEIADRASGALAALFSFSNQLETDHLWSSVNATGRHARFRWTDESGIHTLQISAGDSSDFDTTYGITPRAKSLS